MLDGKDASAQPTPSGDGGLGDKFIVDTARAIVALALSGSPDFLVDHLIALMGTIRGLNQQIEAYRALLIDRYKDNQLLAKGILQERQTRAALEGEVNRMLRAGRERFGSSDRSVPDILEYVLQDAGIGPELNNPILRAVVEWLVPILTRYIEGEDSVRAQRALHVLGAIHHAFFQTPPATTGDPMAALPGG